MSSAKIRSSLINFKSTEFEQLAYVYIVKIANLYLDGCCLCSRGFVAVAVPMLTSYFTLDVCVTCCLPATVRHMQRSWLSTADAGNRHLLTTSTVP